MHTLKTPSQVIFGAGALDQLPALVPAGAKVCIIASPSAVRNNVADRIAALLAPRISEVFSEVAAEPTVSMIDGARKFLQTANPDMVIGVGGGSALDVAKVAAAAGAESLTPSADYFYARVNLPARGIPLIAVPTTAGTGAEATPNGVFTDEATGIKQSIRGGTILPAIALVDPELCVSCPAKVTAASGMDALTQGIEAYISNRANNTTDALAMQGVKLIFNALEKAFFNPNDIAARSDVSEGTLLGAMAFACCGLGAVHGLAHPVGAKTHQPHGVVCGILLPEILRWNQSAAGDKLDRLAVYLGLKDRGELIEQIEKMLTVFQLGELRIAAADVEWIVANSRSGSMKCNPRTLSDDDLRKILAHYGA